MQPYLRQLSWLPEVTCWLACAAVGVLSLSPVDRLPPQIFDIWDKAQHAAGFATLTLLGYLSYPKKQRNLIVALLGYGVVIELAQSATGWRQGDVRDWLADAFGVMATVLLFRYCHCHTCDRDPEAK